MSLKESASNIYEYHHKKNRKQNFSLFEKERGDFIQSMVSKKKWLDILDIWCRDGNLTKYFDVNANVILWADIDRDAMKLANEKWIKTEYVDLNWDWNELWSKKFDVIWAFEIIEHLYFPELVIEKIYNYLKEWWVFVWSIPNAFSLPNRFRLFMGNKKWTPLSDPTHINHFGFHEFKSLLMKKFKKVEIKWLVAKKWMPLCKINPNLFSFMIVWQCEK